MNLKHLSIITPFVAVAIARRNGRAIPLHDIAGLADITTQKAYWIYSQRNWDKVPLGLIMRFLYGCGITQYNIAGQVAYVRRTIRSGRPLSHLDQLPWRTTKRLRERLLEEWSLKD